MKITTVTEVTSQKICCNYDYLKLWFVWRLVYFSVGSIQLKIKIGRHSSCPLTCWSHFSPLPPTQLLFPHCPLDNEGFSFHWSVSSHVSFWGLPMCVLPMCVLLTLNFVLIYKTTRSGRRHIQSHCKYQLDATQRGDQKESSPYAWTSSISSFLMQMSSASTSTSLRMWELFTILSSEAESSHALEETHFRLLLQSHYFCHNPKLMSTGQGQSTDQFCA